MPICDYNIVFFYVMYGARVQFFTLNNIKIFLNIGFSGKISFIIEFNPNKPVFFPSPLKIQNTTSPSTNRCF